MLEVKMMRQKAVLTEQESSLRNKARKEGIYPVEVRSGDMERIQRWCCHCREKIHAAKTQLELKPAITVGNSKKSFSNILVDKLLQLITG